LASTRGFFIGQLIDDLGAISYQVENRARLGYTDLNRMLEDFFKDILNRVLDIHLVNLNATRSNTPGLDLGDSAAGIAFQITSDASSAKVNDTLAKITNEQSPLYKKVHILIIGKKQGSYTIDPPLAAKFGFTEDYIWDVNDLCRLALATPLLTVQDLHRLVAAEIARVRVELEVPAPDGTYPTKLADYIEPLGRPIRSDATTFFAAEATEGLLPSLDEAKKSLDELADELAKLPRISREFYAFLLDRAEEKRGIGGDCKRINADLVSRWSRYPDTDGELRILKDRGFIDLDEPTERGESAYWNIGVPCDSDFASAFFYFVEDQKLDWSRVVVGLDFSAFGPSSAFDN
jgi:hypothetical protein